MNYRGVIICDRDRDFCTALTSFLMSKTLGDKSIAITGVSEIGELIDLKGDYELGLVSDEFKEALGEANKIRIEKLLSLREKKEDCNEADFFKYQNMEAVMEMLTKKNLPGFSLGDEKKENVKIVGIYSPSKHELSLPYSLCVCKTLAKKDNTLFVDLSEIGILPKITGRDYEEDLIDLLYTLENGGCPNGISEYIREYEGVFLLSPVSSPSQFSYITPPQWKSLFDRIRESGFKNIVVFFGSLIQGFSELIREFSCLFIVKKPGDYYAVAERVFSEFVEGLGLSDLCKEVVLPLSVSGGTKGSFRLNVLLTGKLLEFAREITEECFG